MSELELEQEFNDATRFSRAFYGALMQHMEAEFVTWFIREIRAGKSVTEAIRIANAEWDL